MLSSSHAVAAMPRRLRALVRDGVLGLGLLTATATGALAQTFYVDNQSAAATDAGPGTEAQPYRTIMAAANAHKGPGISILVKPGAYREQVTVPASGAAGSPYVFRATGPGVIVDGSDNFANTAQWTLLSGNVWLASSVTWNPRHVFLDAARIDSSTVAPASLPARTYRWVSGSGLYVNAGGGSPAAHQAAIGHRNYGFNMSTRSFVTVDGFEVAHTEDRGINMQTGCADLVVRNNRVSFTGSYGIHSVNGQRVLIDRNTVSDCAFHGIGLTAGASGCTVSNNESFRNAHPTTRQANGIYVYGSPRNTICGNRLHHNQDTGLHFTTAADTNVCFNNRSWANGDHGYDHLRSVGTIHVNDEAVGNYMDGFSFEGDAPRGQLHNCISVDNGLTTGEFDLWVDPNSSVGFVSDRNLFWNSNGQAPYKFGATTHATLASYQAASNQDAHSLQANPLFANAAAGDFRLMSGSPAIDAGASDVASWPATDADGAARMDDPGKANTGVGPIAFGDMGALESVPGPADRAPVVTSPRTAKPGKGGIVKFSVSASDPDGNAIQSLVMVPVNLPAGNNATFTPNATNTGGTFTWTSGSISGSYQVRFVATNALEGSATTTIGGAKGRRSIEPTSDMEFPAIALSQAYPNPASSEVSFTLDLPEDSPVDWSVYDMQGRRIFSESRMASAGRTQLRWNGIGMDNRRAGSGIYFVRVRAGENDLVRRVVHL